MKFSKIANKLRGKISKFSGELSNKLDKTAGRFINEALYGILSNQSVMLTEIGRSLETDVPLKKIEERFCRQLAKEEIWNNIHQRVLKSGGDKIKEDTLLILDLSDLYKKYAEKMEYLTQVRDGSEGGEIVNGYWTNQVIGADLHNDEVIPLYHSLYSQEAPDFKSENAEILKAIDMVSSHTENRGIWVVDRGGDRDTLYRSLLENKRDFIIRQVGNRNIKCGKKEQSTISLAYSCKCPYSDIFVKEKDGKEIVYTVSYGYLEVKLPDYDSPLYLLVVKGFGEKPMMLLTTIPLRRNRKVLKRILQSYLKRWSIEETIRFVKQTYDLENIRVLKYVRLKNMMALLLAVFYFIAVILDRSQKLKILASHVLKSAKRLFGIPDFKYYALGDGISTIFQRSPGILFKNKTQQNDFQLGLAFT
ncbi:hypothetical protein JYT36_00495 [Bacteroidales bacterium AH-315-N07]|nr:hypothetical protein [Bacteroidales bacterium AH-315-N07]